MKLCSVEKARIDRASTAGRRQVRTLTANKRRQSDTSSYCDSFPLWAAKPRIRGMTIKTKANLRLPTRWVTLVFKQRRLPTCPQQYGHCVVLITRSGMKARDLTAGHMTTVPSLFGTWLANSNSLRLVAYRENKTNATDANWNYVFKDNYSTTYRI